MQKRSEFVKQRTDHWRGEYRYQSAAAPERAELDAQAAEAAGIAWAPEAAALPERLGWGWSAPLGTYCIYPLGSPLGEAFPEWYAEAVRRYNAWPAIRAWKARHGLHPGAEKDLLAILDGPAE